MWTLECFPKMFSWILFKECFYEQMNVFKKWFQAFFLCRSLFWWEISASYHVCKQSIRRSGFYKRYTTKQNTIINTSLQEHDETMQAKCQSREHSWRLGAEISEFMKEQYVAILGILSEYLREHDWWFSWQYVICRRWSVGLAALVTHSHELHLQRLMDLRIKSVQTFSFPLKIGIKSRWKPRCVKHSTAFRMERSDQISSISLWPVYSSHNNTLKRITCTYPANTTHLTHRITELNDWLLITASVKTNTKPVTVI